LAGDPLGVFELGLEFRQRLLGEAAKIAVAAVCE
jgi:hypothetical protein